MSIQIPKPPPPHISPRGIWTSKLVLRSLELFCSIVTFGLVANMMSNGLVTNLTLGIAASSAGPSIIWTIADAICIIFRKGRRGIHPGANVALDLIFWLVFIGVIIFFLLVSVWIKTTLESVESDYAASKSRTFSSGSTTSGSSSSSSFSFPSYGGSYGSGPGYSSGTSADAYAGARAGSGYMGSANPCIGVVGGTPSGYSCYTRRAGVDYPTAISIYQEILTGINVVFGFGAILVILHFISFVIACVETHKRRMKRHQTSLMPHNPQNDIEQGFRLGSYDKMQNQSTTSVQSYFTGYSPAQWKVLEAGAHPGTPVEVPACLVPGQGQSPVYKHQAQFNSPAPTQGPSPVNNYQTQFQLPTPAGPQGHLPVKSQQQTAQFHLPSPAHGQTPSPVQSQQAYTALLAPTQSQQQPLPWQRPQGPYGLPQSPAPTYQKVQKHANKTRYGVMAELMDGAAR
ncbi:hypothetical protein QBC44DRAFT_404598 [Cladorrhinum sp. PSN332]|nr:hypothetical protein QBC44DRAFT_404598 [Cladorrhinum sp. PSN332]